MTARARARLLMRRFGLAGGARVAVALTLVLGAVALFGAMAALGAPAEGVTVERAQETEELSDAADDGAAEKPVEAAEEQIELAGVVVHVDGAVVMPGVYELPEGSRAGDAVAAAGGLAAGADTSALNLASVLVDGEKLYVPREGEASSAPATGSLAGAAGGGVLVNLNTATIEELDELPGIGEATARAIVEDRETSGPFAAPEDLMRVSGIGEKKFERLEGLVCV